MRSDAPTLLPIMRSRHQAEILAQLLLHPDQEYSIMELSTRLDQMLPHLGLFQP